MKNQFYISLLASILFMFAIPSAHACSTPGFKHTVVGLKVTFINTSTNMPKKIQYYFGDGNIDSSGKDTLEYVYQNPGYYKACIYVFDSGNNFCDSTCNYVWVSGCKGDYKYSKEANKVTFINTSTNLLGKIKTYFSYGNGFVDSFGNDTITYEYTSPGTYRTCINGYDTLNKFGNDCDTLCKYITITGCPKFGYKLLQDENKVTLIDKSVGGFPYYRRWVMMTESWNVLKDTITTHQSNDSFNYVFQDTGVYYAKLVIYDSSMNACDSIVRLVNIYETFTCPTPDFDYKLHLKDSITVYNKTTGGSNYNHKWDFGDGYIDSSNQDSFEWVYNYTGTYNVCLYILDNENKVCDSLCKFIEIKRCPTPDFDYKTYGDTVTLYNKTTGGSIYKHRWIFENGHIDSSNQDTFLYIFNNAGTYKVCLQIFDDNNNVCDTICKYIEIVRCPTLEFDYAYNDYNTFTFTDKSTGNLPYRKKWIINGESMTGLTYDNELIYKYTSSGTKNVCLIAYDVWSSPCDSICKSINMSLTCGIAAFDYVINGRTLKFIKQNDGMSPFKLRWEFGDNNHDTSTNNDSIVHVYQNYGTYTVTLYTYDSAFQICDSISKTITISPPCAKADFVFNKLNTKQIELINKSTNGKPFKMLWNFGDSNFDSTANNDSVIHNYQSFGTYKATLYIFDSLDNLCDSFSQTIVIQNTCPSNVNFDYVIDWKTVSFIDKTTGGQPYIKKWELINSSFNVLKDTIISSANNDTLNYTFQNAGRHYIKLSVYDTFNNLCDTMRYTVDINPCESSYMIGLDTTQKYKVFIIENSKGKTSTTNYLWTFGDGDSSTSPNPTHTYASFGAYELCLHISDTSNGCNSSYCDTIGLDSNGNFYRSGAFTIVVINQGTLRAEFKDVELFNSVKCYPNPTSGMLNISMNATSSEVISIKVYSMLGQTVMDVSQPVSGGDNNFNIDMSYLQDGMYLVRLMIGNQIKTLKIKKVSN